LPEYKFPVIIDASTNEREIEKMSFAEKFDQYIDDKIHCFKGHRGVTNLEKVVSCVGGYNSIHEFLEDNPGAIEAMIEWIRNTRSPEWESNLTKMGYKGYDEEDDESEDQE
jgi:hypothetical protein